MVKALRCFLQSNGACSWLYCLFRCHFWSVAVEIRRSLTLITAPLDFSACLATLLADDVGASLKVSIEMWVYFLGIAVYDLIVMRFQSSPVLNVHCSAQRLFHTKILFWPSLFKVGRMMMNIRGLILDDPEHTVYLQTIQFAAPTDSASGIEEVA